MIVYTPIERDGNTWIYWIRLINLEKPSSKKLVILLSQLCVTELKVKTLRRSEINQKNLFI